MDEEILEILEEAFEMVPEAFGGKVPLEEIEQSQKTLGVELPEEYKEFIARFGSGAIEGTVILGLREAEFVPTPSFVKVSQQYRKELPEKFKNFVVIGVDGAGNPIGFNYPEEDIVMYDHNSCEIISLADDFAGYLEMACYDELDIQF